MAKVMSRFASLSTTAVFCICIVTCGASQAFLSWSSLVCNTSNAITNVTISNGNINISLPAGGLTVNLTEDNGPGSYWTVNASCIENHTLSTYLFMNCTATEKMYYSLCFYGKCGPDHTPDLFIQTLDQRSLPTAKLGIDEALLEVDNKLSYPVNISQLSDNCHNCRQYILGEVYPGEQWNTILDTSFGWTITITNITDITICMKHHKFPEHSKYVLVVQEMNCTLEHQNMVTYYTTYLPILYAMVVLLCLMLIWIVAIVIWRLLKDRGFVHNLHLTRVDRVTARDLGNPRKMNSEYGAVSPQETEPLNPQPNSSLNNESMNPHDQSSKSQTESTKLTRKKRLTSLDTFRGFSLVIMIFVNYGGGGYWFFNHSTWNGVTLADLVFPWFVWIMGVSIVFSYKGRRKDSLVSKLYQVVRRTIILFGLGLFLNNGFTLSHWRIPGVLQRFAISYFVVALTELLTSDLYRIKHNWFTPSGRILRAFRDITGNIIQLVIIVILEFLWLLITFLLPVHNCPRGYLGPGGLGIEEKYENCTGGAAGAIDRWLFHDNHIYQNPTAKETYKLLQPYDPEGMLGSLNSIVICFLGVQAGRILISYKRYYNILIRFIIWGLLLGSLGLVLCEGQKNDGLIPLNKNLWSLSFILVMAGSGYLLLAIFYLMIDVISWWNGAPFKYPGLNSILVYVGSEVLQNYFPFSWQQQSSSHLNLLAANLVAVAIWIIISYYWFNIDFFVKI